MSSSSPSFYRLQKFNGQQAQEEGEDANESEAHGHDHMHLEEQLTHEKLMELQQIFEEADEDGGGGLDMDEFRIAMRKAMGEHLTDWELDQLFMKVDTNCDGTVDWDEYLTYMLLEYQEKDTMSFMNQDKYIARSARMIPNKHKDSVICTLFMPNILKEPMSSREGNIKFDNKNGKFVTVGKDGIICFWTPEMKLLGSQKIEPQNQRRSIWITDSTYMANAHTLVLTTTNRDILFYDVNVGKFTFMSKVTELEVCATCINFSGTPGNPPCRILVWGDSKGSVGALEFSTCPQYSPFHISSGNGHRTIISFTELMRGSVPTVKAYYIKRVHDDFVRQIRYYKDLGSFVSCCRSNETSMYMGDPRGNRDTSNQYYLVHKGIYCFEYCSQMNVIITGGYDAVVRVWNPYVTSKPIILLQGHKSPILYVTINTDRELIVSISDAREIMVHEMATQKCMQTIFRKMVPVGPRPISSVCVNHCRQSLLVTSNKIAFYRHDPQYAEDSKIVYSHQNTVTAALYNPLFQQVVSIGDDSLVCVWDIHTGHREMQFAAHKVWEHCEEVPREITAMAFGPTYRRLFTAGRDNFVRIWNFNNGACLREIDIAEHGEVTNIICQKNKIVLAGWAGFLEVHVDDPDDDTIERFTKQHRDDILSVDYYPPFLLASSDYEGKIYLWSMETGRVLYLLCANRGAGPVTPGSGIGLNISMSNTRSTISNKRQKNKHSSRTKNTKTPNMLPDIKLTRSSVNVVDCMSQVKGNETSVDKLLFLTHREIDRKTATLVASGADGWVRAWSTHPEGGLLGQFLTCYNVGRHILAMVSDEINEYLITGDDRGYLKVWDISEYCLKGVIETPIKKKMESSKYKKFIYVQQSVILTQHSQKGAACPLAPKSSKPKETVRTPPLLNSFQGHLSAITCVDYVHSMKLIVSASTDSSVRLWTLYGNFVGIFGQKESWHIPCLTSQSSTLHALFPGLNKSRVPPPIPADIRRVASVGTLRVLKHGVTRGWKLARDVLRWISTFSKNEQGKATVEDSPKEAEHITRSSCMEITGQDILGKWHKPFMKHQKLPKLQAPTHFGTKVSVFSSLPVYDLKPLDKVDPPQSILDIQARQQLMSNVKGRHLRISDFVRARRVTRRFDKRRSVTRDSYSHGTVKGRSSIGVANEKLDKASRELSQLGMASSLMVDSGDKDSGDHGQRGSVGDTRQKTSQGACSKSKNKSLATIREK